MELVTRTMEVLQPVRIDLSRRRMPLLDSSGTTRFFIYLRFLWLLCFPLSFRLNQLGNPSYRLSLATSWRWRWKNFLQFLSCCSSLCPLCDRAECGSCNYMDPKFNSITVQKPVPLEVYPNLGDVHVIPVLKDPFIMNVSKKNTATVYTTDTALAHIMVATRSQFSWYSVLASSNVQGSWDWEEWIWHLHLTPRQCFRSPYSQRDDQRSADWGGEQRWLPPVCAVCVCKCRKEALRINNYFVKQIMESRLMEAQYPSPFDTNSDVGFYLPDDHRTILTRLIVFSAIASSSWVITRFWCVQK